MCDREGWSKHGGKGLLPLTKVDDGGWWVLGRGRGEIRNRRRVGYFGGSRLGNWQSWCPSFLWWCYCAQLRLLIMRSWTGSAGRRDSFLCFVRMLRCRWDLSWGWISLGVWQDIYRCVRLVVIVEVSWRGDDDYEVLSWWARYVILLYVDIIETVGHVVTRLFYEYIVLILVGDEVFVLYGLFYHYDNMIRVLPRV